MKLVLGGPGCGKTTHLLSEIDVALADGVDPSRIAFVSFTRKAAHEARDRAAKAFRFSKDDLVYFRTLHSLAFALNGFSPGQLMSRTEWDGFAKWKKVNIVSHEDDDSAPFDMTTDDRYLNIYALSRLRMQSVRKTCVQEGAAIAEVEYLGSELERWKTHCGKMDFTDMIVEFIRRDYSPELDLLIVDEAQDLSALQWKMVEILTRRAAKVIVAGDDDQAIFEWAGADVNHFLSLRGDKLVLPKSYRMSQRVHEQVKKIAVNIGRRFEKDFTYANEGGVVQRISEFDEVDLSKSTMFLGRTKYMLRRPIGFLRSKGYPYTASGRSSVDTKECRALLGWEDMRHGRDIDGATANLIMDCLYHRYYTAKARFDELARVTLNTFAEATGLRDAPHWRDAIIMGESDREYYRAINKRGLSLRDRPMIAVNTIHSVKGGESDHVCLMTDITRTVREGMQKNPGAEARVFYVGASRAKEKLFIWGSQQHGYEIPR